ncbi:hypothetical protein [Streptomyces sp. NBC_01190]|uniref:hypothetical protein n=1 Tax=Streptomyces sp. NBC_01190 TaxID=2903767 RepID=UPI00386762D3
MATAGQGASARTGVHPQRDDGARRRLLRVTASGSSDDGRERYITTDISPSYAAQILRLQEEGATDDELHPVVAEVIVESYFTGWGRRADGLRADFTHVKSIEFEF